MATKIDDIKNMNSNEIVDYLYQVGLSNVFDNYNKTANALNQAKKQQTENAYYLDQMNKRYLGEYASNVGLSDLSGSLQGIANNYAQNLGNINQNYDLANVALSDEYNQQTQSLYNSYAANILEQKQQEELEKRQIASDLLDQALASGFYGLNEDGSMMNLEQFLNQEQYADMNKDFKKYLLDQDSYQKQMAELSSFKIDELNTENGLRVDKTRIADYLMANVDEYKKVTKGEIENYMEKGKDITLWGGSLKINNKSVGITDASGNYYVSTADSVTDMKSDNYKKLTGAKNKPSNGDLTSRYEEENGSRPVADDVMLYKDEDSGYYNYFYYDGKDWHYMHKIDNSGSGAYQAYKKEKEEKQETNRQNWNDFVNKTEEFFKDLGNKINNFLNPEIETKSGVENALKLALWGTDYNTNDELYQQTLDKIYNDYISGNERYRTARDLQNSDIFKEEFEKLISEYNKKNETGK